MVIEEGGSGRVCGSGLMSSRNGEAKWKDVCRGGHCGYGLRFQSSNGRPVAVGVDWRSVCPAWRCGYRPSDRVGVCRADKRPFRKAGARELAGNRLRFACGSAGLDWRSLKSLGGLLLELLFWCGVVRRFTG